MKTCLFTDWIKVHNNNSVYMAKVFLTDEDGGYMVTIQDGKKRFFKVDTRLLKLGELGFFEKVMESAKELPMNHITNLFFNPKI